MNRAEIIKWIEDNKVDIKKAGIVLGLLNLAVVLLAVLGDNYLWLITRLPKFLIVDAILAIPMVYGAKYVRENL